VTVNDTDTDTATNATIQDGSGQLTMMFRINGAAMYARGGNKIPMELLGECAAAATTTSHSVCRPPALTRGRW